MIHICTHESLVAGGFDYEGYCPTCCKDKQPMTAGYIGCKCRGCGFLSADDMREIVRNRRKYLKLDRKQMAERAGISPVTLRRYENWWPSHAYWLRSREIVLNG